MENINKILSKLECDGKWQEQVRQFVGREVYYCVSSLVSELAQQDKYLDELMEVCVSYNWIEPANEHLQQRIKEEKEEYTLFTSDRERDAQDYCYQNDLDPYTNEAYEHWIISDWLADKLLAKGEMVIKDFLGLTIWGRCTTGQSIYIDRVINEIYIENCLSETKIKQLMGALK